MSQEIIMTLVNDCNCVETGECLCEEMFCDCECECVDCEREYVSCACGGNCQCNGQRKNTTDKSEIPLVVFLGLVILASLISTIYIIVIAQLH